MQRFINPLKVWLDAGLNLLYPAVCQICQEQRATAAEGYVCNRCWSGKGGVRFVVPPYCQRCGLPYEGEITTDFLCGNCHGVQLHFNYARSAVIASPLVLEVIHRYKYRRDLWFESFLADLLVRQAVPALQEEKWDLIVPVPLHPVKKRDREFNQAESLAVRLGRAANLPVNKNLLRRVEWTRTQTQLTRQERASNVKRAFAVRAGQELNGEKIILVDDGMTTGATTSAGAWALSQAGAGEICVWTVARGLMQGSNAAH